MTDTSDKEVVKVLCIHYPIWFQKDQEQEGQGQIKALLDSGSEVNAMSPAYAKSLGLKTWKINVGAQKIDGSALKTFEIVIVDFQVEDKNGRPRFFQGTFLVADTKFEIVLGMLVLKISNANIAFGEGTLTWKFYTTNKALSTTKQVQLVDPKEFVIAALDADSKTFVVHVAIREWEEIPVHSKRQVQIQHKAQVGALLFDEASTEISAEYSDYSNVFSAKNTAELSEKTGINEHAIKLE